MNRKIFFPLCLLVLLTLLIAFTAGCPARTPEEDNDDAAPPPTNGGAAEIDINSLTAQWDDSGHALNLPNPSGRDGCILCHDGHGFSQQIDAMADIPAGRKVGEGEDAVATTATDCAACHTGYGQELMEAGTVSIPTAEDVSSGLGALCMACHNARREPDIADARRSSPHSSSQADVFTATGGIRLEDFDVGSTGAHVNLENACVACHMPEDPAGFAYHGFDMPQDFVGQSCSQCHSGITDFNMTAGGDYDGDGQAAGFQDEVQGLLSLLEEAISEELEGASFASRGGAFVFTDANDNPIEDIPDEVYLATYNWYLISTDGSLGIHNPAFTISLLQQSYQALTGEEVPNADLK